MPGTPGTWADNREYARRHLPHTVFEFIDGGAEDEFTLRENRRAFDDLAFKPRVLAGNGRRDLSVEILGEELALPVITAPTGLPRLAGSGGEKAAARGAELAGTVSILSTISSFTVDAVAASAGRPQWMQIYLYRDEQRTLDLVSAAKQHGFGTLVITADAPTSGNRERDKRSGMTVPFRLRPGILADAITKPRWLAQYLFGPPMTEQPGASLASTMARRIAPSTDDGLVKVMSGVFNADQDWDHLRRVRDLWSGPLVLKGVMCAEDARLAIDAGCQGVVVSNHGGRQLDGLPATIDVLPEVVAEVGDAADVLLDGGVRRGTDVAKALALGAKACLIGRPWLYGMARGGADGVAQVLGLLGEELDRVMALVGATTVADLTPAVLRRRPGSGWIDL